MLHAMYVDDINLAYLLFLKPLLTEVQAVNKSFEAKDADQTKLLHDLECLLVSLIQKVVLPTTRVNVLTTNVEHHLDPQPYLGYLFENHVKEMKKKGLSPQDEDALRKRCVKFVVCLVQQIRQRLPDNIEVLSKVAQLSVEKALSALKPSLIPLLEAMGVEGPDIQEIESQWRAITCVTWSKMDSTEAFWCEVNTYQNASGWNPFGALAKFALAMMVMPYSNAEVERSFSELNLVKTKLRNRMAPAMANAILTIRAGLKRHAKTCFDYELPEEVVRRIGTAEAYKAGNEPSTSADLGDLSAVTIEEELFFF